jgi:hypothetical protein
MFLVMDHAPPTSDRADAAADASPSPYGPDRRAAERTDHFLAVLRGIVDDSAALIKVIRNQAEQANWCGAEGPKMVGQLARSVRQTMAFAEKLDTDARMTAEQRAAALVRREKAEERALARKMDDSTRTLGDEIRRIADAVAREVSGERGPKTDREHLLRDLKERFDDPSVDDELNGRTYGEILATIMEDVGVTADLSAFTPEQLARVYGPAEWRRRGFVPPSARGAAPPVPPVPPEAAVPAEQTPPDAAKAHDPP